MDDFWADAGGRTIAQGVYEYLQDGVPSGIYERWAIDQLQARRRVVRAAVSRVEEAQQTPFYYVRLDYDMRGAPTSMEVALAEPEGWYRANHVMRGEFARVLISRPDGTSDDGYLELTPGYLVMAHAVATNVEFYRQHDDRAGRIIPLVAYYLNIDLHEGLLRAVRLNNVLLANLGDEEITDLGERGSHLSAYQLQEDGSRAWSLDSWFDRRGNCLRGRSETSGSVVEYRSIAYEHE